MGLDRMFKISQSKKDKGQYCCAYNCTSEPIYKKGNLCHKHYARKLRITNPIEVRFNQAVQKAKSRGKEWTITLDQFKKLCERTGYLSKGKRGQNATLDRLCNVHDYHIWNIGIKTNRANAKKGDRPSGENFDCPF